MPESQRTQPRPARTHPRARRASPRGRQGKNQSLREALQTGPTMAGLSLSGFTRLVPGARPQTRVPSAHTRGWPGAPDFSRSSAPCAFILNSGTGQRTVRGDPGKGTGQSWPLPRPAWWRHPQRELWRAGDATTHRNLFLGLCLKALTVSDLGEPDAVTNLFLINQALESRATDSGVPVARGGL